jgi:hypothetical protein
VKLKTGTASGAINKRIQLTSDFLLLIVIRIGVVLHNVDGDERRRSSKVVAVWIRTQSTPSKAGDLSCLVWLLIGASSLSIPALESEQASHYWVAATLQFCATSTNNNPHSLPAPSAKPELYARIPPAAMGSLAQLETQTTSADLPLPLPLSLSPLHPHESRSWMRTALLREVFILNLVRLSFSTPLHLFKLHPSLQIIPPFSTLHFRDQINKLFLVSH